MEAICFSETSVVTQRTTRRYIPEVDTLRNHRCENLKSYKLSNVWKYIFVMNVGFEFLTAVTTMRRVLQMYFKIIKLIEYMMQ
jgi:hypothetical protein